MQRGLDQAGHARRGRVKREQSACASAERNTVLGWLVHVNIQADFDYVECRCPMDMAPLSWKRS